MNYPDIDGMTPQLLEAHHQGFAAIKAERGAPPARVEDALIADHLPERLAGIEKRATL